MVNETVIATGITTRPLNNPSTSQPYIGRFAPSPSGTLHFGSLIAALGSYLQARANHGKWLVRIEDIDPPREVKGAATDILQTLERLGLCWDDDVLYQSTRFDAYWQVLHKLLQQKRAYYCACNRQRIQSLGGFYDGHCRSLNLPDGPQMALRLRQTQPVYQFHDQLRGSRHINAKFAEEDFIIHRRDGLFAYNLAVVVDDNYQGITEIVRGADLIEPTVRQNSLYHQLGWQQPDYLHLPLALNADGNKLSKQNHAPGLNLNQPTQTLAEALLFLGQPLPESWQDASIEQLLRWSITHWSLSHIQK